MKGPLEFLDFAVVGAYFALVFGLAWWVTVRDRKRGQESNSSDYFLASRSIGWFVIGASLFASNIGSEHLVGLAGAGARGDIAAAQFEILAVLILMLLGWVFAPFYLQSGVFTMPEFLERRFSSGARTYLSVISILSYVLTKISVTIFAGALVFEELLGVEFWTGAIAVVVATGLYTILGGLRAVIYTDMLQMFVLIGGSITVTIFALDASGGWGAITSAIEQTKGADHTYLNLWRPATDPDYPWTGILFGAPILGIWYWCTDQFIVQRVLSAKNETSARRGALFGGGLKLLPIFLFVFPGIIAYGIYAGGDTQLLLSAGGTVETDRALPALVMNYLPVGLKGLVTAGLLAALMSSLSSVFNSCSTLLTIDFYRRFRPQSSEKQLVRFGQWATAVLVVIGLLWIPLMRSMQQSGGLFKYLQEVQAYISPPIAAVFMLGLFFPRLNARGAMAALWVGFVFGIGKLVAIFVTEGHEQGVAMVNSGALVSFASFNFLHYAFLLFVLCSVVLVAFSVGHPVKSAAQLEGLVYRKASIGVSQTDVLITVGLILGVLALWIWFSPLVAG
ncbi:MAG: sodium/solute symporter [Bacteroidetes bacterium]|nr:sodium/solute symporter [Bacteroidota bacterium]